MARSEAKSLPQFRSLDELVDFFDGHDLGEYLDQIPEVDFEVEIKRKVHLIALDAELADKLTEFARSRQTSPEALVNAWVRERVLEQV